MARGAKGRSSQQNDDEKRAQANEARQQMKQVLKHLRSRGDQIEADKDEMLDCRSDRLAQHFTQAIEDQTQVKSVDQAHVDAQNFRKLGEYSRRQARQLKTGLKDYDVKSFVEALGHVMAKTGTMNTQETETTVSFVNVGSSLYKLWRAPPAIDFMYGAVRPPSDGDAPATQPKQRKRKAPVVKGKNAVQPAELELGDVEMTETDRHVKHLRSQLRRQKEPVNFWVFVVDPSEDGGFTRTIENVFHTSFLVKDMFAKVDFASEPPTIEYTDPDEEANAAAAGTGAENDQDICGVDMATYKAVIRKYNIQDAMIEPLILSNGVNGVQE